MTGIEILYPGKDSTVSGQSKIAFGLLKPDAIARNLDNAIYERMKSAELLIYKSKRLTLSNKDVEFLYGHNKNQDFWGAFSKYMTIGKSEPFLCVDGRNDAVNRLNDLIGCFDPSKATEGTIRRDMAISNYFFKGCYQNLVHSSSDKEKMIVESSYFFPEEREFILKMAGEKI
jgi:nucleoside-diphosphate kinase